MDGKLVFDTARYNPGGDFNVNSGDYRCPVTGIYVIFSTITAAPQVVSEVSFSLLVDGVVRKPRFCPRNAYNQIHSVSITWVTHCNVGQNMWLQVVYDTSSAKGILVKGDDFTSMSGFLLAAN
eukprot:GHVT01019086.1.p1 GENE.GHVT01019086.1~~GHVT01019086.1.p1  ORF type:complete len:123 (-),score=0.52 GHVT01019086.1:19-387(-)